jgi:hypothetical protein
MIKDNPFNDDTTADEKYQFTCMIDFRCVFRDRAILERINFRDGEVVFVKRKKKQKKQKKPRCSLCRTKY